MLAFDKSSIGSVRHTDENGFMHVDISNITKETVNPYYGREIPGWESLHLDPEKIYYGYRPLVELERGAETFNNLPLLSRHEEVSAEDPRKDLQVGSLGTDARIDRPYLTNSLIVCDQKAIDGILNETQKELSCAYRYDPDFTPGEFAGARYDFVMKNIRGNHVALVHEGRAGSDVVVADENTIKKGVKTMGLKDLFKKTTDGKLAMDEDLEQALEQAIAEKVEEKVAEIKQPEGEIEDPKKIAEDGEETDKNALKNALLEKINTLVKGKGEVDGMSEEDFYKWVNETLDKLSYTESSVGASDEDGKVCGDEEPEDKKDDKPAMDENTIKASMIAHFKSLNEAANEVRPLIGDIDMMAFDSAEDIYGKALSLNGYKIKNFDKSAYKGMVAVLKNTKAIAMDSSPKGKSIEEKFSGLKNIAK